MDCDFANSGLNLPLLPQLLTSNHLKISSRLRFQVQQLRLQTQTAEYQAQLTDYRTLELVT